MCRVLVASNGYCAWLTHLISNRAREDARLLLLLIRASFSDRQAIYGAPRVF
jgi:hypothetical protein